MDDTYYCIICRGLSGNSRLCEAHWEAYEESNDYLVACQRDFEGNHAAAASCLAGFVWRTIKELQNRGEIP